MQESVLIKKAASLIESVKEKTLSVENRRDLAVELAAVMLEEAGKIQEKQEKRQQAELAGMMRDPLGKVFVTAVTDQCFRSKKTSRVANQLVYVLKKYGIPSYLPFSKKWGLHFFEKMGQLFHGIAVPAAVAMIRKETNAVILPGEEKALIKHMRRRKKEGVRVNLNHLGEAILGEEEAAHRLKIYLEDLAKPEVEYISIKISTIYSQIQLLGWKDSLDVLSERLRELYRAAIRHRYVKKEGTSVEKFVNLDMEEYRDLELTVALFQKVLDEPEFYNHSAGIVLQAYLPDSYLIQQELTVWAMQRVIQGGAPIKIRIVKGANLAMEQFEASLRLWPQAPYPTKGEVDANYKRMIHYGFQKSHAKAVHIGVASHNLFDIAYALLLRAENGIESSVCFEMLEGMADNMRKVVQALSGDMLLYCPAATKKEFQNAVAYLIRRLDENTAPENFLRQVFDLRPGSSEWDVQVKLFSEACLSKDQVSYLPARKQNRLNAPEKRCSLNFQNEPDTDWALPQNRRWAERILSEWKDKQHGSIPLVIAGKEIQREKHLGEGLDPSFPSQVLYRYSLASSEEIELAIKTAKQSELKWSQTSVEERAVLLRRIADEMRCARGDLMGAMLADTGKTIMEGDVEISEAIDFADYYAHSLEEWHQLKDVDWKSKGTVLVTPPWNFPCSIAAGGITAALAAGNCVIYKPPLESVLSAWTLVQLFWRAGVRREVLQFVVCEDDPVGTLLIKDPRISTVILTGGTATAKFFLKTRPGMDLLAETGGKNTMVITGMADRDLAIKDLVQSAFGHAGQKCSACSIALLEAEVYDDPHFLQQLKDAAQSLKVGSPWNLSNKINPLIHPPTGALKKGLTELEPGEEWLLKPQEDPTNPHLWSPGIKLGVTPQSFTFQNELFGPVLSLVRAESVEKAFDLMNQTPYGLTAGLHTLDEREQKKWLTKIEAGNCYINRTMTGAVVQRQPFGGCKESGFGKGAKAGGPNYLVQLMEPVQKQLPLEKGVVCSDLQRLTSKLEAEEQFSDHIDVWKASLSSYSFYWEHYFSHFQDVSLVRGQDNFFGYLTHPQLLLRGQQGDTSLDLLRVYAAAFICKTPLSISLEDVETAAFFKKLGVEARHESEEQFISRLLRENIQRVRLLKSPAPKILELLAKKACHLNQGAVMANGRIELLHVLRELSISHDYHRYGNLGEREGEKRAPLINTSCEACSCDRT